MKRALGEYLVIGVSTSIPFHQALMDDERFREGDIHTLYVEENEILNAAERPANGAEAALAAAMFFHTQGERAESDRGGTVPRRRAWAQSARGRRFPVEQGWRRTTG